ncbi:MAG: DUF5132 domain-containing protein [bacterium]|nr:DUF5132 domain-containing protein [bacterium]
MAFVEKMTKGWGPAILVGAGVALVAPVILPLVGHLLRPVVKSAIKGGMIISGKVREMAAEASEQISDLVAEVRAESSAKTLGAQAVGAGQKAGPSSPTT